MQGRESAPPGGIPDLRFSGKTLPMCYRHSDLKWLFSSVFVSELLESVSVSSLQIIPRPVNQEEPVC